MARGVFFEELIFEQRYHEVEEQGMQLSERITLWEEEPEVQRPVVKVLGTFELQQRSQEARTQ